MGGAPCLVNFAAESLGQREICGACDKAPRIPIAGTSTASAPKAKLQVDLLFLDDTIASRATDVFAEFSLFTPAHSKNAHEVWRFSCSSPSAIFGAPKCIQMDAGGEKNTKFGRIFDLSAVLPSGFRERVRALGSWKGEMVLLVAFTPDRWRMIEFPANRSPLRFRGA